MQLMLEGKFAVVTGASRGIGRGVAIGLAQEGADVALIGRSRGELEEVAAAVVQRGRKAMLLTCDVTDSPALERAFSTLERVDILINNAGMNIPEPFLKVTPEHYDAIFNLNVRAAFFAAQLAAAKMMGQPVPGGVIVNMTSQMGHVGAVNRTVYCASKHALEGLTKALALELAPHQIRVVSVAPTFTETPMTVPFFRDPSFRQSVLESIPLGQTATIEDIVNAVLFVASPAARMITGASLLIDGGWTAK